ncbi:MAG: FtsX-like permease family protein [Bacteroidota bacterium]
MRLPVNLEIALTHIITRKKQTLVTALGITIAVAIYLFMNSLSSGFSDFSRDNIFKNNAHIVIDKDDEMSLPLFGNGEGMVLIKNPQITKGSKKLSNPEALLRDIKEEPYITNALSLVEFSATYRRGSSQMQGQGIGVNMREYAAMFETEEVMIAGSLEALQDNLNGIIVGAGIAENLSLSIGDNITVSSTEGVNKVLRIVGIFETGASSLDKARSFVNTTTAQQFLKQGPSYVTTIYANTVDPDASLSYVEQLADVVPYNVDDWTVINKDILTQESTREIMMTAISIAILFMAGFGIYNILSTTISQKIDDIAILKATGFNGKDVIRIFIMEALLLGVIGTMLGILGGLMLINIMSHIYIGQPVGYFPISMEAPLVLRSTLLGLVLTFCAGYFPARKAADVDPVEIFRK